MSNEIQYKEPTKEQLDLMREFSDNCVKGIELIMKCEPGKALEHCSARLQEAMGWMNSYVINGGKLSQESKH